MNRCVLIVAPEDDAHGAAVAAAIERSGGTTVQWGGVDFPAVGRVAFDPMTTALDMVTGDTRISTATLHSVWWRRSGPFRVAAEVADPRVRRFCLAEVDHFWWGVFDALPIPVINRPSAERAARKPRQLTIAHNLRLTIPATIITTDPDQVIEFWHRHDGRCVYKPLTAPTFRLAETRALTAEHLNRLDALAHAPIIVQEHVPRGADVRVNVIGDHVFAAEVTTVRPEADIDWRLDLTATWQAHSLPQIIADRLRTLIQVLGLDYGCIDLRRRPDGEYVFFEVNPAGQFLFVEVDAGSPLAQAMAELLLR